MRQQHLHHLQELRATPFSYSVRHPGLFSELCGSWGPTINAKSLVSCMILCNLSVVYHTEFLLLVCIQNHLERWLLKTLSYSKQGLWLFPRIPGLAHTSTIRLFQQIAKSEAESGPLLRGKVLTRHMQSPGFDPQHHKGKPRAKSKRVEEPRYALHKVNNLSLSPLVSAIL